MERPRCGPPVYPSGSASSLALTLFNSTCEESGGKCETLRYGSALSRRWLQVCSLLLLSWSLQVRPARRDRRSCSTASPAASSAVSAARIQERPGRAIPRRRRAYTTAISIAGRSSSRCRLCRQTRPSPVQSCNYARRERIWPAKPRWWGTQATVQ